MIQLKLSNIAEVGQNRYRVTFVDNRGSETEVVCQVEEHGEIRGWSPVTKMDPDIFMLGYADTKATGRALFEYHDRKGDGRP